MSRKRMLLTFNEARHRGFFDEYPVLPPGIDPQLHLSRSDRPQPFWLICSADTVLVQMSGEASVAFKGLAVSGMDLEPGDFVYIPAGAPHRLTPRTQSIQYRFKAEQAGLEGAAWYCESCGEEIHREVWDTQSEPTQAAYLRVCEAFNARELLRRCAKCGIVHDAVNIAGNRWADIAAELAASEPSEVASS